MMYRVYLFDDDKEYIDVQATSQEDACIKAYYLGFDPDYATLIGG